MHFQLMNGWTVTNALNWLLKIFWMLWDDGYPGGWIDKLLTEGMETTPSAWGTGDGACEAINPTKEIRTTIVNLAMFSTLQVNNWTRMNKYHNRPSIIYTEATRKTEQKALRYAKTFGNFYDYWQWLIFPWKKNLKVLSLLLCRWLAPDLNFVRKNQMMLCISKFFGGHLGSHKHNWNTTLLETVNKWHFVIDLLAVFSCCS